MMAGANKTKTVAPVTVSFSVFPCFCRLLVII